MIDDDVFSVRPMVDALIDADISVKLMPLSQGLIEVLDDEQFDLIIVDIMMEPNGFYDGVEAQGGLVTGQLLVREIRDRWPEQKVMALSLHNDAGIQEWFNNQENMIFVKKGRTKPEALPTLVRTLIDNEPDTWAVDGATFIDAIQLKPSIFGMGIDFKKAWSALKNRP